MREFSEQELVRREKLNKIRDLGIDPFGHKYDVTDYSLDIKEKYAGLSHDELEEKNIMVRVAGRIKKNGRRVGRDHNEITRG